MRAQVDCNLKLVGFQAERDFDAIVSADLFERLKPAPDIFLAAAAQLGADPAACVVVEDAAAGVQAARAAGAHHISCQPLLAAATAHLQFTCVLHDITRICHTGCQLQGSPSLILMRCARGICLHASTLDIQEVGGQDLLGVRL
jgi:hypothetical protein